MTLKIYLDDVRDLPSWRQRYTLMTPEIYLDDVSSTFMTSEFYLNDVRDLPWWREFYLNDVSSTLMTSVMDLLNSWRRPAISNAAPHRPEGRRPKWIQSFFIRDTETKIKYISPSPFLSVTTNWSNIKLHRLVVVKFIYSWLTNSIEAIYRGKATNYPCPSYPVGTFPTQLKAIPATEAACDGPRDLEKGRN